MKFSTYNPATAERLKEYSYESWSLTEERIQKSVKSYEAWSQLKAEERVQRMQPFVKVLEARLRELAEMITTEMGRPIKDAEAEVKKCIHITEYFLKNGPSFIQDQIVESEASKSVVVIRPMGPLLGIMPWNYPLLQVIRFVIPTMVLGNTVLIKHADNTAGCAELIEDLFIEAGLGGIYQNLRISVEDVGTVIDDFRIRGVSLTGSVRAGKEVGARAGKNLKKMVLELGGSDAYVILEDADLEVAAQVCVSGRFINSGQSCIAAKRFIVVEKHYEAFQKLVIEKVKDLKVGDPMKPETQVGPIARQDLRDQLADQVQRSLQRGARLAYGMNNSDTKGPGFFYAPTVLVEVEPGNPAFDEEIFGPVCVISKARDEKHAFVLANKSEFGLGSAILSKDTKKSFELARSAMDTGSVFINDFVKSNPLLPFGGVKNSGVGRELSRYGMLEFANVKTIWIK